MSDTFDPDSWPYGPGAQGAPGAPGASGASNGRGSSRPDENGDYDPSTFGGGETGYDYGDDDYGDFSYDEPERAVEAPAGEQGQEAGYDEDYDRFGENDYDRFDEDYDREPSGGGARRLLAVVVVVLVVGAIGAFAVSLVGGKGNKAALPPATVPTSNPAGVNGTGQTGNTAPTTAAPTTAPATAPAEVLGAMNQALTAWGKFAVDGDLNDVKPYFVNGGPQYAVFLNEAPVIQAKPPGGAPMQVVMQNPQSTMAGNAWLIRGTVVWSRPPDTPQQFPWELHMTRLSPQLPWQVESVRQF